MQDITLCDNKTQQQLCDIHNKCSKCPPFVVTQAPGASLQGEDLDCGGVAAAYYEGVGTPRPACHRQRSEAVA